MPRGGITSFSGWLSGSKRVGTQPDKEGAKRCNTPLASPANPLLQQVPRCIAVSRLPEITVHAAQPAGAVGFLEDSWQAAACHCVAPNPQLPALIDTILAANWTLLCLDIGTVTFLPAGHWSTKGNWNNASLTGARLVCRQILSQLCEYRIASASAEPFASSCGHLQYVTSASCARQESCARQIPRIP